MPSKFRDNVNKDFLNYRLNGHFKMQVKMNLPHFIVFFQIQKHSQHSHQKHARWTDRSIVVLGHWVGLSLWAGFQWIHWGIKLFQVLSLKMCETQIHRNMIIIAFILVFIVR